MSAENETILESKQVFASIKTNPLLCSAAEGRCPIEDFKADFEDRVPPFNRIGLLCERNGLEVIERSPLSALDDAVIRAVFLTRNRLACGYVNAKNKAAPEISVFINSEGIGN